MTLSTHRRPGTGRHLCKSPSRWVPMLACSQSLRKKRCRAIRIAGTSTTLLFFSRQSPQFIIRPMRADAIMVFLSLQSAAPPGRRVRCPRRFDAGRVPPSSVFQSVFQDTHKMNGYSLLCTLNLSYMRMKLSRVSWIRPLDSS